MKLILLGAPGSGKGTISEYIVSKYNFIHLSTGSLFRKRMDEKGLYWEELKNHILKGQLVPDDLVNKIVKSEILNYKANQSYILDGYPRTIEQANFLSTITDIDYAIFLDVAEKDLEKRLTGRRVCNKCKKIYNIYFYPPQNNGVCDLDGSLLIQRKDDDPNVIKERIETYKINTLPLIEYYKKLNKLITINSSNNKDEIKIKIDNIILNKPL